MKKVAVVLCGSGFKDGSEIRESVATLWALSQHPVEVQCFAPDAPQADVINCLTLKPMDESRNMLTEAARIARGKIFPLEKLSPTEFSAILIPGGFGVAKNLCTFATEGSQGSVRPELRAALETFHTQKKPIGAICIAPAVVALVFQQQHFELTLGPKGEAAQEIEKLGHTHVEKKAHECHVDEGNRVVTSPAYMIDSASLADIFEGIRKTVHEVIRLA